MPSVNKKLLFIDTNIWLDFYRARGDAGLKLLNHVEAIKDRVIVTYQLESEFKTNRQKVLQESWANLKAPDGLGLPNIVADAKTTKILSKDMKDAKKRVESLRKKLVRVIAKPTLHDPVYKICQRIFHRKDDITLTRSNDLRHVIRRKAFRRFLHGCPPRKRQDVSIGDAFNWEWMVHCATERNAELVIVTRDSDFGITIGDESYINDHLKQEFQERVSKKRKIRLCCRLTDALKHFNVKITTKDVQAEADIVYANPDDKLNRDEVSRQVASSFGKALPRKSTKPVRRPKPDADDPKVTRLIAGPAEIDGAGDVKIQ